MNKKRRTKKIKGKIVKILSEELSENNNDYRLEEINRFGCMKRSYDLYNQHCIYDYNILDVGNTFCFDNRLIPYTVVVEFEDNHSQIQYAQIDIMTEGKLRIGQEIKMELKYDKSGSILIYCGA